VWNVKITVTTRSPGLLTDSYKIVAKGAWRFIVDITLSKYDSFVLVQLITL